ncbi:sporulation protein [Bacillus songklensis]|uniref:Sporulation protein n=1 Tax=Bacillus songklensis TaxID=1069116 RepID=A0ABV8B5M2_9BACI
MALFNKVLAQIGIGAATVDAKLFKAQLTAGEKVEGIVEVYGGNTDQKIDCIYLRLYTTYVREVDDKKVKENFVLNNFKINDPFTIQPGEKKEIPFSFNLPVDTPVTMGNTRVWVTTGLDIKNAIDPRDVDYVEVLPNPIIHEAINAMVDIGFRLRQVECEEAPHRLRRRLPFMQEFEFVPTTGPFYGKLDEVELTFLPDGQDRFEVFMEVDRRARGLSGLFAEALEMDESMVRFYVTDQDIPKLQQMFRDAIQRYS